MSNKLIIAYHGSNNKFTKFDYEKIGTNVGTSGAGLGFYFTNNKEEALDYGKYVYECKLHLKKIVDNHRKRLFNSPQILNKIIFLLYKSTGNNHFENYGFDGDIKMISDYDRLTVCRDILDTHDSDTEIMMDLFNAGGFDEKDFLNIFCKWGYNYSIDRATNVDAIHHIVYCNDDIKILNIIEK